MIGNRILTMSSGFFNFFSSKSDYFERLVTGASRSGADSQAASRKGSTTSQMSGSESDSRPTTAGRSRYAIR